MLLLLGYAAALMSGIRVLPQLHRTVIRRDFAGLSITTAATATTTNAGWTTWAVLGRDWPLLASSSLTVVGFGIVTVVAIRASGVFPTRLAALQGAWLAAMGTAWATAGTAGLGAAAAVGSSVMFFPQAILAWRAVSISGVAAGTYILAAVNESLWLGYALWLASPVLAFPFCIRLPVTCSILIALTVHARRGKKHIP